MRVGPDFADDLRFTRVGGGPLLRPLLVRERLPARRQRNGGFGMRRH